METTQATAVRLVEVIRPRPHIYQYVFDDGTGIARVFITVNLEKSRVAVWISESLGENVGEACEFTDSDMDEDDFLKYLACTEFGTFAKQHLTRFTTLHHSILIPYWQEFQRYLLQGQVSGA